MSRFIEVDKTSTVWILRALIFIGSYAVFFSQTYPGWKRLNDLSERGARTTAKVVGKEPNNHQSIRYSYIVDGQSYTELGGAGKGGVPAFGQVHIGDDIVITYLPSSPVESLPGSPVERRREWSFLLFTLLPMACLLLTVGVRRKEVAGSEAAHGEKTA